MADPKWQDALPDDLKQEPMFRDIPDVATLAKVARDLKAFQGTAVRVPGSDAPDDVKKAFREDLKKKVPTLVDVSAEDDLWQALGRPADEKGYDLAAVKVDGAAKLNAEQLKAAAKALGLTKAQFAKLAEATAGEQLARGEAAKASEGELRKEWGAAFEERSALAKAAALRMGLPPDVVADLSSTQLKAWANAAKSVSGEGRAVGDHGGGGGSGTPSPAEALAQAAEIRCDPDYYDSSKSPARHALLQRKVAELTRLSLVG